MLELNKKTFYKIEMSYGNAGRKWVKSHIYTQKCQIFYQLYKKQLNQSGLRMKFKLS